MNLKITEVKMMVSAVLVSFSHDGIMAKDSGDFKN